LPTGEIAEPAGLLVALVILATISSAALLDDRLQIAAICLDRFGIAAAETHQERLHRLQPVRIEIRIEIGSLLDRFQKGSHLPLRTVLSKQIAGPQVDPDSDVIRLFLHLDRRPGGGRMSVRSSF
jgi:hypothetical protein